MYSPEAVTPKHEYSKTTARYLLDLVIGKLGNAPPANKAHREGLFVRVRVSVS